MKTIVLCAALVGVILANPTPSPSEIKRTNIQLRTFVKVHAELVAKYQPEIDDLASDILLQSKVGTENINLAKTQISKDVQNSADTYDLDISIVKNLVATYLKMPVCKTNASVKSCLNTEQLYANALSTKKLRACYDSSAISSLTTQNSAILQLKASVVGLPESCRSQHQLATDTSGMELCLTMNLVYSRQELDELVGALNAGIQEVNDNAKACILNEETTLSDETAEITKDAQTCLSLP